MDLPVDDDLAAVNAAALRARVRELEVENGLIQRELAHVGEVAERQGQQLQCAPIIPLPFTRMTGRPTARGATTTFRVTVHEMRQAANTSNGCLHSAAFMFLIVTGLERKHSSASGPSRSSHDSFT